MMENKRIDIEECEYINGFCYKTGMLCKDVAFCNIRRIQQLKAENEKLENKNNAIHSIADDLQQRNHNLTLENEELHRRQNIFNIFNKIDKYKTAFDEIEGICKVNAINTCWTALNLCDKCEEKEECGLQSPLAKLEVINNIIEQAKEGE